MRMKISFSQITSDILRTFRKPLQTFLQESFDQYGEMTLHPVITGSGGLTLANHLGVPFTQEVIAVSTSLQKLAPKTDVAIELGGEDAKIIYFENGNVEQRMNGICAGGTGSFIDQMASLLQTDATGLNEYAKDYKALYPIAARCGVFRQDRYPAADQRRCDQAGLICFYFSGSCKPDNFRSCLRKANPRTRCIPGRSASFPVRAERILYPYPETG